MHISFDSIFWTEDVARQFGANCIAAVAELHAGPGEHVILVDLRNAVLQTQDIYDKMKKLIGGATAARIALVAEAPLARMQTKRLQIRDNIMLFATMPDAEAWLFEATRKAA